MRDTKVPNLIGLTQSAAEQTLTETGLVAGTVKTMNSATTASGNVSNANPAAGTPVSPGSPVNLEVSSGPAMVNEPDVEKSITLSSVGSLFRCGLSWAIKFVGDHFIKLIAGIPALFLLYAVIFPPPLVILAISVPNQLSGSGYTSEVAATHLRDAMNKLVSDARTSMKSPDLALQADLPDFVVPAVGLTLQSLASHIRTFFYFERRRNITGDFTYADADKKLSLRLRNNGIVIYKSSNPVDLDKPDELLEQGAREIIETTLPYLNAVLLYPDEPAAAITKAQKIIAERPEVGDPNVAWAHNLIGDIYYNQERYGDAIKEFNKALKLDNRFATAYNNLGLALRERSDMDAAVENFRAALRLEPNSADAHQNLSTVLSELGRWEAKCLHLHAISILREIIKANPLNAVNHRYLGEIINSPVSDSPIRCIDNDDVNIEDSIGEFREAIRLDPHDSSAHLGLGLALVTKRKSRQSLESRMSRSDEAINAFNYAIVESGGHLSQALVNLASELHFRGRIIESERQLRGAIMEYERRIRLTPNDVGSRREMGRAFLMLGRSESALDAFSKIELSRNDFRMAYTRGFIELAAGKYGDADEHLTHALRLHPNDAYVVLWLHLARRHSKHSMPLSELQVIKMNLEQNERQNQGRETERDREGFAPGVWPLPIVRLFMHLDDPGVWPLPIVGMFMHLDEETVAETILVKAEDEDEPGQQCEAAFYVGEWYWLRGRLSRAATLLQQAVRICPMEFIEFFGALTELTRLPNQEGQK